MSTNERLLKLATATPVTLAKVDAVLNGTDTATRAPDPDVRTTTFSNAAKMLQLSRPTIYRAVRSGRLKTVALNGTSRILLSSIFDFANGKGE